MDAVNIFNTTAVPARRLCKIGINVIPLLSNVQRRFKNGSAIMTGFAIPSVEYMFGLPEVKLEFYPSKKGAGQTYRMPNGTWSGLGGQLRDEALDIFLGPVIIEEDTIEDFGVFHPYYYAMLTFIASARKPDPTSFFTFLVNVQISIWYCLLLCFVLIVLTSAMADNSKDLTRSAVTRDAKTYFWIYLAALFCEGSERTAKSRTSQLLQFSWLYLVIIFSNVLFSQFASVLTVRIERDIMHTVQDIADKPDLLPLIVLNSHGERAVADSPLPQYRKLYKRAVEGRGFIDFKDYVSQKEYQKVKDGDAVMMVVKEPTVCFLGTFCLRLKGNRRLYFVEEKFFLHFFAALYNKDKGIESLKRLNRRCRSFVECGIQGQMFATCAKNYWKCEIDDENEEIELKLKHLYSVFYLLLICLTVSSANFVLEILTYKFSSGF